MRNLYIFCIHVHVDFDFTMTSYICNTYITVFSFTELVLAGGQHCPKDSRKLEACLDLLSCLTLCTRL